MTSAVGALLTFVLVIALLMIIIAGVVWAISASSGNVQAAQKGKVGVFVAPGSAAFAGGGVAWMSFLLGLGDTL